MIVRLGFVVAASIAAYAVKQVSVKNSRPPDNSKKREGIVRFSVLVVECFLMIFVRGL